MTTIGYALLGLLARQSRSGYELAKELKVPVSFFWYAPHSQIYPELARLEAAGLVTHRKVEQQTRPSKKVYSITEAGRARLHEWVTSPVEAAPPRDELVLKAYFLWLADPQQAIELFREHERRHAKQLAAYQATSEAIERDRSDELTRLDSPMFANYATLQRGIGYEREYANWCRWVADQIQRLTTG
jgi:DNA-binding PadR family transcriptional regulator